MTGLSNTYNLNIAIPQFTYDDYERMKDRLDPALDDLRAEIRKTLD